MPRSDRACRLEGKLGSALMEAVTFKDKAKALTELHEIENVEECVILQTCNRIELFIVTETAEKTAELAKNFLAQRAQSNAAGLSKPRKV
jgi:glutamyl-tRNA reductase